MPFRISAVPFLYLEIMSLSPVLRMPFSLPRKM
uniref:Uncharacterized protein n=1 Tax=Anguilla anguilla TaxID=7936 RepID=A0A0E9XJB0_ANGAN